MPRRLIQRAFLGWLEENRSLFAVEIKLGRRTDTVLQFTFAGINSAISGVLTTWEISVFVMRQGECWDYLLDLNAETKLVPGGYVCDLCPPESRPVFSNRPALWTDHLFEPLLEWVNESLAKAKWLALYGSPDYATWARLLPNDMPSQALRGGGFSLNFSAWAEGGARRKETGQPLILLPCRVA
jgi:hypothetical protein